MTTNPYLARQGGSINSVLNPYKKNSTQKDQTEPVATNNQNSSTTSSTPSNSSSTNNTSNRPNFLPTNPEMNRTNTLFADSTLGNKKRAIEIYSEFASLHGYPEFNLIPPPTTDKTMQDLKTICNHFSLYFIHEARQKNNNEKYAPGTAEGYFSSFFNALKDKNGWVNFSTPNWYNGMGRKIASKLSEQVADEGEIPSELQDQKKAITRTPFKNALHALLGDTTAANNVQTWQRW